MKLNDYLTAKQVAADADWELEGVIAKQQEERTKLAQQKLQLDMEIAPYRAAAGAAAEVFRAAKLRLLEPWEVKTNEHWPSATIHAYGNTQHYGNKAWLRMMGGHRTGEQWQWTADIVLYGEKYIQRGFGPSKDNKADIMADFEKHLGVVTKMLEDSGYIIVPAGVDI